MRQGANQFQQSELFLLRALNYKGRRAFYHTYLEQFRHILQRGSAVRVSGNALHPTRVQSGPGVLVICSLRGRSSWEIMVLTGSSSKNSRNQVLLSCEGGP